MPPQAMRSGGYYVLGSGHFPLGRIPPDISHSRTTPLPFYMVYRTFRPHHHHHAPICIKRSIVNVYKIDSG